MRSITTKLTLSFWLVSLVGVLIVAAFVARRAETAFNRFLLDNDQRMVIDVLARYHAVNGSWDDIDQWAERERPLLPLLHSLRDRRSMLVDARGNILLPEARGGESRPPVRQDQLARGVPITDDAGQPVGYLIFDNPLTRIPDTAEALFLERLRQAVFWGALGATLVSLLAGVLLARTIARPVRLLTAATQELAGGELGYQVEVNSKDELGRLADSFNAMSAGLAESSRLRKQMTADIAHDLRTPLSVILGYTEALADGKLVGNAELFEVVHGEAKHLNHLVDDLRLLSLADAGELTLNRQSVAPRDLLRRAAAAHFVHADERGVTIRVDEGDELPPVELPHVWVDLERMAQVFNNLVSNALRYTPAGGTITLAARDDSDRVGGNYVVLTVADTGAGIDAAALPHIFDRFYRADKARTDNGESGLGLPIVKSIVQAHGGSVDVTSVIGQGTTFSVALPTEDSSAI